MRYIRGFDKDASPMKETISSADISQQSSIPYAIQLNFLINRRDPAEGAFSRNNI